MDAQPKRIIDLSEYGNVGIILKLGSGVFCTNQVAGYACQHPEVEGAFYPLPVKPGNADYFRLRSVSRARGTITKRQMLNLSTESCVAMGITISRLIGANWINPTRRGSMCWFGKGFRGCLGSVIVRQF
jgi:hypothetical protein